MLDVAQRPQDVLYEIRQKGQKDPCYVVVPNPTVRFYHAFFIDDYSLTRDRFNHSLKYFFNAVSAFQFSLYIRSYR